MPTATYTEKLTVPRVNAIRQGLEDRGLDGNVLWVVSDRMTKDRTDMVQEIAYCNTPGTDCGDRGEGFAQALAAISAATEGQTRGVCHSQSVLQGSIAFEMHPELADEIYLMVLVAGTAIDSDGGTAMGKGDVIVYVSDGSWRDPISMGALTPIGPKLTAPNRVPGSTIYDTDSSTHNSHFEYGTDAFNRLMAVLTGD